MKNFQDIQNIFDKKLQRYLHDIENNNIISDDKFIAFLDFAKDIDIISQDEKDKYITKAKELREDYPFATKIIMDEEKILCEGIYKLDDIYKKIDELAMLSDMIKKDKCMYITKDDENAFSNIGIFIHMHLVECEWFTKNVKVWAYMSKNEGNTDLISACKKENEGVW